MTKKWNYKAKNGTACFSDYVKSSLLEDQKTHENSTYQITRKDEESKNQRGMFEGATIPLWVYLDGHDYRDNSIIKHYREEAKKEFNGEMIIRSGKKEIIGKSTKGILTKVNEKVILFLEDQYGIDRKEVLDTKHYKYWRDAIFSTGECETYIQYLEEIGRLPIRV